jgi:hypothetical protein
MEHKTLIFVASRGRSGSFETMYRLHKNPFITSMHETVELPELDHEVLRKIYFYGPRIASYIFEIQDICGWDEKYWPIIRDRLFEFAKYSWTPIIADAGMYYANHLQEAWDYFHTVLGFDIRVIVLERPEFKHSFIRRGVDLRIRETRHIPLLTRVMENFNEIFPLTKAATPLEALENFSKIFEEKITQFENQHPGHVLRVQTKDLDLKKTQDKMLDFAGYPSTNRRYQLDNKKHGNADSQFVNFLGRTAQWLISKDDAWPAPWYTDTK